MIMKVTASVIASAFVCTVATAQVVNPSLPPQSGQPTMPGHGMPGGRQTLPVPTLLTPAADVQIRTPIAASYTQSFSWSPPGNGPVPERYVLCVALSPSVECAAGNSLGKEQVSSLLTQAQLTFPAAFHDRTLYWTVAACGAGYGLPASAVLNPVDPYARCSWAPWRKLDATPRIAAPELMAPGPFHVTIDDWQTFTWRGISEPGVSHYRFCLAEDLRDCQSASLAPERGVISIGPVGTQSLRADVDLAPLRQSGRRNMVWTVFPCFGAQHNNCVNTAQPMSRSITIRRPPPRTLPPPTGPGGI
jgi:hypothetical protein